MDNCMLILLVCRFTVTSDDSLQVKVEPEEGTTSITGAAESIIRKAQGLCVIPLFCCSTAPAQDQVYTWLS